MSKIWIQIDEKDAIRDGLRHLRLYTEGMFVSPDSSMYSDEVIKQIIRYYRSNNPVDDIAYYKILGAAVIKTVNDNPDVFGPKKDQVAVRCAQEFVECLKTSKEFYQATCRYGKYENKSQQEIDQILKEKEDGNRLVQRGYFIHKVKKICTKYPEKILKKGGIGEIVGKVTGSKKAGIIAGTAALILETIVPPKIKKEFRDKAKKVVTRTKEVAKKTWTRTETYLDKTELGSKVKTVLVATGGLIKDVAEGIHEVAHGAFELADKGIKSVGKGIKSLITKAKTRFAR